MFDDLNERLAEVKEKQRKKQKWQERYHIHIDIGNMLTFADYFFDGFIVDWIVRGKIADSLKQTQNTRSKVQEVLQELEQKREEISQLLTQVKKTRISILERTGS